MSTNLVNSISAIRFLSKPEQRILFKEFYKLFPKNQRDKQNNKGIKLVLKKKTGLLEELDEEENTRQKYKSSKLHPPGLNN